MSSTGFGTKLQHETKETFETSLEDGSCEPKCEQKDQCKDVGLIVAAIVLALIWTFAVYAIWTWCASGDKSGSGCGLGSNPIGAFLVWLLFIIIFFSAIYSWNWNAIVAILVFFLIIMLIGWWLACAC